MHARPIGTCVAAAWLSLMPRLDAASAQIASRETAGEPHGLARVEAEALADFRKRVRAYETLRENAERDTPELPKRATPDQIELARRHLSRALMLARAGAKPGDLLEPAVQSHIRRSLQRTFAAPGGRQLRAAIRDENPAVAIRVNAPYPEGVVLAAMPFEVLAVLPELPEDLEFRFVGTRLVLYDSRARVVVDYMERAMG